ncbi:MAG: ribonuclease III [Candidatus Cloacimonetes bacterium]|nr:ribonuclease III [Candidatus Cloacimonadota bacterium]MBL7085707.1 ribonuclease III [Candidatus Cloacimonadota bacterium]
MLLLFSKNMNENGNNYSKQIDKWKQSLINLENKINYTFKNKQLLEDALTHRSFYKKSEDNKSEILEFLGDSVLELIVTEFLYNKFPDENEGNLTKIRSKIISKNFLYEKASEIELSKYILFEDKGLKNKIRNVSSINADIMESVIAAIFLDSSYAESKFVITNIILNNWESALGAENLQNFKSYLQEWAQAKFCINPKYIIAKESGQEHKKRFYVSVKIADIYRAKGQGKTKKSAEQNAAKNLLEKLKINSK